MHPQGGCGFRKVGYYDRVEPPGLRVARWHCPEGHRTFSLLPDFAAARVSSSLREIEQVVERFDAQRAAGATCEVAAASVQPRVERASAQRWVARRRRWVRAALAIAIGLLPEVLAGCEPSLASVRAALDAPVVLVRLREIAAVHLAHVPAPVGFAPLPRAREHRTGRAPHETGPDPPPAPE